MPDGTKPDISFYVSKAKQQAAGSLKGDKKKITIPNVSFLAIMYMTWR